MAVMEKAVVADLRVEAVDLKVVHQVVHQVGRRVAALDVGEDIAEVIVAEEPQVVYEVEGKVGCTETPRVVATTGAARAATVGEPCLSFVLRDEGDTRNYSFDTYQLNRKVSKASVVDS